jgi:hypothetical protein
MIGEGPEQECERENKRCVRACNTYLADSLMIQPKTLSRETGIGSDGNQLQRTAE